MWKLAMKKGGSDEVRLRKRFPGWRPGGGKPPPWGMRFERKQEKKKARKKERQRINWRKGVVLHALTQWVGGFIYIALYIYIYIYIYIFVYLCYTQYT